ncbi:hypothetical protein BH24PSE2_BH24PSE2_14600 [soil metagenome]
MIRYLAKIDARHVPLLAGGLVVLVAAMLASSVVLPQYRAYRTASGTQTSLQQTMEAARAVAVEQAGLQTDVERLESVLRNDADGPPRNAMEASVISGLQNISWRREIELLSVQPLRGAQIGAVEETLFQLELTGEYADLHAWLRDLHLELDSVVVKRLSLAPLESGGQESRLRAEITVAAYGTAQ